MTKSLSGVEPARLLRFSLFQQLEPQDLDDLAANATVEEVGQGRCVLAQGSDDQRQFFLLEGEVQLDSDLSESRVLRSGTAEAAFPLAHLRPASYSITTLTPATLLEVDGGSLNSLDRPKRFSVASGKGPKGAPHPMVRAIYRDLQDDSIVLPSLPGIAQKVSRLISDDQASLDSIAKVITADPAITAKLVKAANSPLYRGVEQCQSCSAALSRLGMETTRQLVASFAVGELFRMKITGLRQQLKREWKHAIDVAALSAIFAQYCQSWGAKIDVEQAMLAGLLHDIGMIPLLKYAQNYPDLIQHPHLLQQILHSLKSRVGEMLLQRWDFSEDMVMVASDAELWHRSKSESLDYCDVVQVAQLHYFAGTEKFKELPPLDDIPAFKKVGRGQLTAAKSVEMLNEAKEEIQRLRHMLLA